MTLRNSLPAACILILISLTTACNVKINPEPGQKLWYEEPAMYFEQAMPLGNGRIGATVFGDPANERIMLNEASLWTGTPVNPNMNPEAYKHLPAVRQALFSENYPLADSLVRHLQGSFSQSYAPLGDIHLRFNYSEPVNNYYRELDIQKGIATVKYKSGSTEFLREVFVSNPDQIMIIHLSSKGGDKLNFTFNYTSQLRHYSFNRDSILVMKGWSPVHAEPGYRGDIPNAIVYDEERGMRFEVQAEVDLKNGEIIKSDSSWQIVDAEEAVIRVSIATSFNGFDKEPGLEGKDESKLAAEYLTNAQDKNLAEIRKSHVNDVQEYFDRVSLTLTTEELPDLPTDQRLKRYSEGEKDHDLEALYFQYGRYLMISASRPGGIPMNLQGIWNPHIRPPWSSNYTVNINTEMNYWPAEVTNLSEMHEPLFSFIKNLSLTGESTAKTFYDCGGWACSHNSDLWAMTNPVGDFGKGQPVWANWSMAGPWLSTHLWEHFQFTLDTVFLSENAYPLMKGAARFCLDYLVENPEGFLVTAPSTSPENMYLLPDGYQGATLYGSTADMAMIKEHFNNTLSAIATLDIDHEFENEIREALRKMYPYQIGKNGNLQEWYHDWEDADPQHRHVSHLFGLYPGVHISPGSHPQLSEAIRKSLELRGDGGTGWSKAWKINLWARLLDGDHAYSMLKTHLNYVDPSPEAQYSGGGTFPNLWDAHPPFQIDGNFGGTAGIAEMLLQSHNGEIHLLPALPEAWPDGKVTGLVARGGIIVDMEWMSGELVSSTLYSKYKTDIKVRYMNQSIELAAEKGVSYMLDKSLNLK